VLLENDTRLLITISFDNDFDKYFDDALAILTGGDPNSAGFDWLENLEDFPKSGYRSLTWEEIKNFLVTTQTTANIFANTDDASVLGLRKALRVQKAFQQVLDHPEAAQALKHPALKPLLEEAADWSGGHNGWQRGRGVPSDPAGHDVGDRRIRPCHQEKRVSLELDDIQSAALRPRPSPYVGVFILLRIDDRRAGRELIRRLIPALTDATNPADPSHQAWVSAQFTFQGLKALGVPQDSLDSFPLAFQQGMAARAAELGDIGESAPENWEKPFGTADVHIALSALSPDAARLESVLARARKGYEDLSGVSAIWRQDCHALPTEKEAFGFKDGPSRSRRERHSRIEPHGAADQGGRVPPGLPKRVWTTAADATARGPG
jgi:hypothetical protein